MHDARPLLDKAVAQAVVSRISPNGKVNVTRTILDGGEIWPMLRRELIERPAWVAEKVRIPELASLARFDLSKASLKLERLKDLYPAKADVKPDSKREAMKSFERFIKRTKATVLDDLTIQIVIA